MKVTSHEYCFGTPLQTKKKSKDLISAIHLFLTIPFHWLHNITNEALGERIIFSSETICEKQNARYPRLRAACYSYLSTPLFCHVRSRYYQVQGKLSLTRTVPTPLKTKRAHMHDHAYARCIIRPPNHQTRLLESERFIKDVRVRLFSLV